jgi:hypothetical protein
MFKTRSDIVGAGGPKDRVPDGNAHWI